MSYPAGSTYTLSSDGAAIILTAQWNANATITISFNSEGGSASRRSRASRAPRSPCRRRPPTPATPSPAGSRPPRAARRHLALHPRAPPRPSLDAQWSANATDDYSFNAAGGSPTPSSGSGLDGSTITLPGRAHAGRLHLRRVERRHLELPRRQHLHPLERGAAIILTAQWNANATITISFNSEGGARSRRSRASRAPPSPCPARPPRPATPSPAGSRPPRAARRSPRLHPERLHDPRYAQWSANPTITISFNSEGGSAVPPVTGLEGTTVTLPAAPTYAGYTFAGWFTAPPRAARRSPRLHP